MHGPQVPKQHQSAGVGSVLEHEEEKQGMGSSGWKFSLQGHCVCLDPFQYCSPPDQAAFHPFHSPKWILLFVFILT